MVIKHGNGRNWSDRNYIHNSNSSVALTILYLFSAATSAIKFPPQSEMGSVIAETRISKKWAAPSTDCAHLIRSTLRRENNITLSLCFPLRLSFCHLFFFLPSSAIPFSTPHFPLPLPVSSKEQHEGNTNVPVAKGARTSDIITQVKCIYPDSFTQTALDYPQQMHVNSEEDFTGSY